MKLPTSYKCDEQEVRWRVWSASTQQSVLARIVLQPFDLSAHSIPTEFFRNPFILIQSQFIHLVETWATEASGFGAQSLYESINASSTSKMEQTSSTNTTLVVEQPLESRCPGGRRGPHSSPHRTISLDPTVPSFFNFLKQVERLNVFNH